jgi:hypothetical protein
VDDSQVATAPSSTIHQEPVAHPVDFADFNVPARQAPPCIMAIAPGSGPKSGGTSVHVLGKNFLPSHQILFGTTPAITYLFSDTAIQCLSPQSTHAGTVHISILGVPVMIGGGMDDGILQLFKYEDTEENEM